MKRRKKQGSFIKKAIIVIIALCWLIFFFIQFFLGGIVKNILTKNSDKFINAQVNVNTVKISPANASVLIEDLQISSPPTFNGKYTYNLDKIFVDVSLLNLLKKTFALDAFTIEDSKLFIERNKEGKVNILSLVKEDVSEQTKTDNTQALETTDETKTDTNTKEDVKESTPLPNLLLSELSITSLIDFIDYKTKQEPFNIGFNTKITARNIKTFGSSADTGNITIEGNLKGNDLAFKTNVSAEVSPLVDLTKPSFSSKATIESIDMETLSNYQGKTGIKKGIISIQSSIVCVEGQIQKEKSIQKISIKNLLLTDKMKDKLKGQNAPTELSFKFHIFGSIDNIQTDFLNAFINAILNPEGLLGKELSEKISKKLSKNKDAQKILATTGFGAALGISEAQTESNTAIEETTASETVTETVIEKKSETNEVKPEEKKEDILSIKQEAVPTEIPATQDKTKTQIDEKIDQKVNKLKGLKKNLF